LSVISGEKTSRVRLASRSDGENLERPRWFFARAQGKLLPSAHPQRLERLERFERLERPTS
jgi:hypothetical protein